ncbi:MAG: hypothetical protein HXY50_02425 [Ignavibacteriaceae bacterium]|nr:hypothetical protein [Ignavibacteriaceae bacterium]
MKQYSEKMKTEKFIVITSDELTNLLNSSKIIFEQDTKLRDYIRILQIDDNVILQETTNTGEIIIRAFKNVIEAMNLVNDRLSVYDKMWDGCGCKINYYE